MPAERMEPQERPPSFWLSTAHSAHLPQASACWPHGDTTYELTDAMRSATPRISCALMRFLLGNACPLHASVRQRAVPTSSDQLLVMCSMTLSMMAMAMHLRVTCSGGPEPTLHPRVDLDVDTEGSCNEPTILNCLR